MEKVLTSLQSYCKKNDCEVIKETWDEWDDQDPPQPIKLPQWKVVFPDGFSWVIHEDPKVLEVNSKPITLKQMKKGVIHKRLQDIFSLLKKNGLTPHERIGGGHIHIGLKEAFGNDRKAFRNYVVHYLNSAVARLGFTYNLQYSPPLAALDSKQHENFQKLLDDFDRDEEMTIEDFAERVNKDVYYKTYETGKDWNKPSKYHALNFTRITNPAIPAHAITIEMRDFRPEQNLDNLIFDAEYLQRMVKKSKHCNKALAYQKPFLLIYPKEKFRVPQPFKAIQSCKKHLEELGLSMERFEPFLYPPLKDHYLTIKSLLN